MNEMNAWAVLSRVKLALLVVPLVAMITTALISIFVLTPVYRASTVLLVFKQPEDANIKSISFNRSLVRTYSELARSRLVLEEVLRNDELRAVNHLEEKIKVEPIPDTELIRISAEAANPSLAALTANEVARALIKKVADTMSMNNIQIVDAARPPDRPVWPNYVLSILFAGVFGLVLVTGFVLVREYISGSIARSNFSPGGNSLMAAEKAEAGTFANRGPEEDDRVAP